MTSGTSPLVSVVTPVYNGEPYLRECIESVLAQTYPNWDHTIVNNCSEDRTREIAEQYAARDPRIRVHNNDVFVSCEANHNIAVRQISPESKYCKIVAADDWLYPGCLSRMVDLAQQNPTVGIVSSFGVRGEMNAVIPAQMPYTDSLIPGREICRATLLGGPYLFGQPTSVLYRADLIRCHDPFFNESNIHADAEVCFELLRYCDFGFVHEVLTYIRMSEKSLSSFSDRINTYLAGNLYLLLKYGPIYLTRDEMQERIKVKLRNYYAFLAESVLGGLDMELWRFHSSKLRDMGLPLRYSRLFAVVARRMLRRTLKRKVAV